MTPLSKRYSQNRRCGCSKRITNGNVSGMCKRCLMRSLNADPELAARRAESQRRRLREDFSYYVKKCATLAENRDKAFARPEVMAKLRDNAARLAAFRTPENEAKRIAGLIEANKRRRHDWLPDEYRPLYFRMLRNGHGFRAPEAKQIILAQIKAERDRHQADIAKLSPFERQERALAKGAQLIANDSGPMFGDVLKVAG